MTESLQLDDWIYTIGERAGLYHQRVGTNAPPTRIHHSHPPAHHQERVKKFQEDWAKAHGTVVLRRYTHSPILATNNKATKTQLTNTTQPLSKTHKTKEPNKITQPKTEHKKISRKSKPNLTDPIVVITPDALTLQENLLLPTNDRDVMNNINSLQATDFPIVPQWVQTQLPRVSKSHSRVYYSNDISLTQVKRYVTERLVCEENSCIVKKSFYDLASSKQLIGIYNKTNVSLDEGKTIYDIHAYIAYESQDNVNESTIMAILSRSLVCARQLKLNVILFDLDSSLQEPEILIQTIKEILNTIGSLHIDLEIGVITREQETIDLLPSDMIHFTNLKEAISATDILQTLFVSFYHMRFVLNTDSMFHNCSSIGIQSYGLTNLQLLDEKNYFVG